MIAKEIPKKTKGSFKRLADYITRADKPEPIAPWITHCSDQPYEVAVKSIESAQDLVNSKKDLSYHLILSFHPEDDLSPKRLAYIESECCKALGFDGHQRMSALHRDTNNPHLHIAINRVHPKTKRQITPYYSHKTLAKFSQRMELELGLTPDNHTPKHELSTAARDMEAYSGKVSMERYVIEEVRDSLQTPSNWQDLQQQLQRFGLSIKPHKDGFVVGDGSVFVKADLLGKDISDKIDGFGEWQQVEVKGNQPEKSYQPAKSDDLWSEYQIQRNEGLAARKALREEIAGQSSRHYEGLQDKYTKLRDEIKRSRLLTGKQKFKLYKQLGEARRKEYQRAKTNYQQQRTQSRTNHPLPTWQEFLVDKAVSGDMAALKKLQNQVSKRGINAVLADIENRHGATPDRIRDALQLQTEKQRKTSEKQRVLTEWIASRNALVGKAADVQEHRPFGKQTGVFTHQGTRQIGDSQYVALLSRDGITYVKPISEGQQRFLKNISRGTSLDINDQGQIQKQKRARS